MKINEYNQMMKWLTRPKQKPMPITEYIDTMNRLYGNEGGVVKDEATPKQMEGLKKRLNNARKFAGKIEPEPEEERFNDKILKRDKYEVQQPKKKIIKKTLIVEKPKPTKPKPPIIDYMELQDWLNEIDPQWWTDEDGKKEVLLRVPKRELKGLASLLKRG